MMPASMEELLRKCNGCHEELVEIRRCMVTIDSRMTAMDELVEDIMEALAEHSTPSPSRTPAQLPEADTGEKATSRRINFGSLSPSDEDEVEIRGAGGDQRSKDHVAAAEEKEENERLQPPQVAAATTQEGAGAGTGEDDRGAPPTLPAPSLPQAQQQATHPNPTAVMLPAGPVPAGPVSLSAPALTTSPIHAGWQPQNEPSPGAGATSSEAQEQSGVSEAKLLIMEQQVSFIQCFREEMLAGRTLLLSQLNNLYKMRSGEELPYKASGYEKLRDFIVDIPGIALVGRGNKMQVRVADTAAMEAFQESVVRRLGEESSATSLPQFRRPRPLPEDVLRKIEKLFLSVESQEIPLKSFLNVWNTHFPSEQLCYRSLGFRDVRGLLAQVPFIEKDGGKNDAKYFLKQTGQASPTKSPSKEADNKVLLQLFRELAAAEGEQGEAVTEDRYKMRQQQQTLQPKPESSCEQPPRTEPLPHQPATQQHPSSVRLPHLLFHQGAHGCESAPTALMGSAGTMQACSPMTLQALQLQLPTCFSLPGSPLSPLVGVNPLVLPLPVPPGLPGGMPLPTLPQTSCGWITDQTAEAFHHMAAGMTSMPSTGDVSSLGQLPGVPPHTGAQSLVLERFQRAADDDTEDVDQTDEVQDLIARASKVVSSRGQGSSLDEGSPSVSATTRKPLLRTKALNGFKSSPGALGSASSKRDRMEKTLQSQDCDNMAKVLQTKLRSDLPCLICDINAGQVLIANLLAEELFECEAAKSCLTNHELMSLVAGVDQDKFSMSTTYVLVSEWPRMSTQRIRIRTLMGREKPVHIEGRQLIGMWWQLDFHPVKSQDGVILQ